MPVEIRELTIKMTIDETGSKEVKIPDEGSLKKLRESIVKECTEAIVEILNVQKER